MDGDALGLGLFLCEGYGIAEALDVDALLTLARDELAVPFCQKIPSCEGPAMLVAAGDGVTARFQVGAAAAGCGA